MRPLRGKMNATRIAFFAAFKPLRPGAERIVAPLIEESRVFLSKLGELLAYETIVTTLDEGQSAVEELLSKNPDVFAVFVTGGTERVIQFAFRDVNLPLVLLACDRANSLAAALEMLPRLREMGKDVKLIFVERYDEAILKTFENFLTTRKAVRKLKETTLGIFGSLSPWLIGCTSDYQLLEDKFGLTVKHIDLLTLYQEYQKLPSPAAENEAKQILSNVGELREPSFETLVQATKLYLAVRKIAAKEHLNVLTIKCFEMLPVVDNTLCLALSKLNDEGIIAGCEGDINAALSMLLLNYLTGRPTWMANPVSINYERNTLTIAHCTVPLNLIPDPGKTVLRSHFESGRGVAVQGPLAKGEVTLARLGGPSLDRMMILYGEIVDSDMGYGYMCRTQAEVKLKGSVADFVDKSLGNHLALVPGDVFDKLIEVCALLRIEPLTIC